MTDDPEKQPEEGLESEETTAPSAPPAETSAPEPEQEEPPTPAGDEQQPGEGTVSLLDLMAEEQAAHETKPRKVPPDEPDEATPTGMPIPTNLPPLQRTPPLPPISRDKTLPARPPERDEDAT
ncbi:MAG: hypothetical protein RRC07_17575, partial [Anaerolineae bacterium]|nr:hypothetical protein [Anaerolineae bacterium]